MPSSMLDKIAGSLLGCYFCNDVVAPGNIRGFLSRYQQILPATHAFHMCTACSAKVIENYEEHGFEFLLRAFNEPGYLEELTGLTAMQTATQDAEV